MQRSGRSERVSIRPGVSVLSVLRHLNYKPWFALAEFADNSIQSYLSCKKDLIAVEGKDFQLCITITIDAGDTGCIKIRDNAGGIHKSEYARAFRPAQVPTDCTGLCEFGMGMKSAACWFSPRWTVRTSALGEDTEKTVAFDINRIVHDEIEELDVAARSVDKRLHFTEVILNNIYRVPIGRTVGKIKEHLTDIYRVLMREEGIIIKFDGEVLKYQEPGILVAPHYKTPEGQEILWRKDLTFDFGDGLKASGFAALRKTASTSGAGFALFRRRRLVQGSGDEGYRPEFIFGKPNTFVYQRLFGELHLEGFEVSHTKDGFKWDENETPFLEILKEELSDKSLPILQQAREYRVQPKRSDLVRGATIATTRTSATIEEHVPAVLEPLTDNAVGEDPPDELGTAQAACKRVIDVELHGQPWRIILELTYDPAVGDWLEISDQIIDDHHRPKERSHRILGLRLSLSHPFMERFAGSDPDRIEPLLRVAAALGLAEMAARDSGVRKGGTIRRNVNELLRNALWRT